MSNSVSDTYDSAHDPLCSQHPKHCPCNVMGKCDNCYCDCDIIAEARADERRLLQEQQ